MFALTPSGKILDPLLPELTRTLSHNVSISRDLVRHSFSSTVHAVLSLPGPVLDAERINSLSFVEERRIPDYVLNVKEVDSTTKYFINQTTCDQLSQLTKYQLDHFLNCSDLDNMALILLAAPQVPLVLLEAACVSTAPFDCLDQVNAPMTITGIVLLRLQDNPLMLTRKSDYPSLHQGMKNYCVVVWCGTETSSCGSQSLLSKKKTRGRNVIRKRQQIKVDKENFLHKSNAVLISIVVAVVGVCSCATICIKQSWRQNIKCAQLRQFMKGMLQLFQALSVTDESGSPGADGAPLKGMH